MGSASSILMRIIFTILLALFVPPMMITYVIDARYRREVFARFPILKGNLFPLITILWWLFAWLTFMPRLFVAVIHS